MSLSEQVRKQTYKDYLTYPDDERWEIIDGIPYMQSAPSWQHQSISRELLRQFSNYLLQKSCEVFSAPFDLRLSKAEINDEDVTNVYQPDLVIICDKSQLKGTGYFGIPNLIIEISSPSTAKADRLLKFNIYERFGVQEYWIVEPDMKLVSVFILQDNNRYGRPELYTETDNVAVSIFADLIINLNTVFDF